MTTILYFFWDGFSGEVDLSGNYGWIEYTVEGRLHYTVEGRLHYTAGEED